MKVQKKLAATAAGVAMLGGLTVGVANAATAQPTTPSTVQNVAPAPAPTAAPPEVNSAQDVAETPDQTETKGVEAPQAAEANDSAGGHEDPPGADVQQEGQH